MRIAQINLPVFDNNGVNLDAVHETLARNLCVIYGGFTVTAGRGAWVDNGRLYHEDVKVYQVAYDPAQIGAQRMRDTAQYIGRMAKQIAMFIVIDGEAEILTIE
jgi:hypothetical protein